MAAKDTIPPVKEAIPAVKEAIPAVKEAIPAGKEAAPEPSSDITALNIVKKTISATIGVSSGLTVAKEVMTAVKGYERGGLEGLKDVAALRVGLKESPMEDMVKDMWDYMNELKNKEKMDLLGGKGSSGGDEEDEGSASVFLGALTKMFNWVSDMF